MEGNSKLIRYGVIGVSGIFGRKEKGKQRTRETTRENESTYQEQRHAQPEHAAQNHTSESAVFVSTTWEEQARPKGTARPPEPIKHQELNKKQLKKLEKQNRPKHVRTPEEKAESHARRVIKDEHIRNDSLGKFYRLPKEEQRKINRSMQPITPDMEANEAWIRSMSTNREKVQDEVSEDVDREKYNLDKEGLDDEWLNE